MRIETAMNYSQLSQAVAMAAWQAAGIHALTEDEAEELNLRNWLDTSIQDWEVNSRKLWMGGTPTGTVPS